MKVLVVAPHPDDEVIGLGGTIARHVAEGDAVTVLYLTNGQRGIPDLSEDETSIIRFAESQAVANLMGFTPVYWQLRDGNLEEDFTEAYFERLREMAREFDQIYGPSTFERHRDHVIAATAVMRLGPSLLYEVDTPLPHWDSLVDISPWIGAKLAGIFGHASQEARNGYARAAFGLAMYRGQLAGPKKQFAEVFWSGESF